MIHKNQELFNKLNILLDGLLSVLAMVLGYWIRFAFFPASEHILPLRYYLYSAAGLVVVQFCFFRIFGLYQAQRRQRFFKEIRGMLISMAAGFSLLLMTYYLLKFSDVSRGVLAAFVILEVSFLIGKRVLTRLLLRHMRSKGYNAKHVLLVGNGEMAQNCIQELRKARELGYHVIGYVSQSYGKMDVPCLGNIEDIFAVLKEHRPDEVIAALEVEDYPHLPHVIRACEAWGIRFSLVPCYARYIPSVHPQMDSLNGIPLMNLRRIPLDDAFNAGIKRAVDILGSLALILVSSPLMLFAAIGVKLSSPGPILFKQERVGYNGRNFKMYKFRSMRINTQEKTGWSTNNDPRRTKFGSFIRKYSIDELPQFFNVLKGDMSLVGPRPEVPHYVEQFREEIPLYMVKHQVRPGITGWAQVNGLRGDTSIAERINHDIYYIENWSLLFDIKILFRTLKHVSNEETLV